MKLSEEIKRLIDRPNFGHLATLMRDGSPQVAPVWVGREGDLLLVGTGASTLKARNIARDARVGLSVIGQDKPYCEAQIRGAVVERRADESLDIMDALAHQYTGRPFPWRDAEGRIVLVIRPIRARYRALPFEHTPP